MPGKRRHTGAVQLSVIVVNYNVRDFLHHALISLQKAMKGIRGEIIVVDNASDDGSVEMVRRRFPSVILIASKTNVGFAKANNLALQRTRGKYFLLINPDTLVQEDTLRVMMKFFEENPDVGLAGCKILNPDGSFQLACRRSFPTPWVGFTKMSGLSALFPHSRLFGRYNLTYLSPDETYEIDAVSGSFMMVRREVYEQVGGLDEEFFMYGEDLDWCYRIQQAGWKNYYVHSTQIIHYKGESTKRSNLDEIKTFYQAMHLFVMKHLSRSHIFAWLLRFAISISSRVAMLRALLRPLGIALIDIILVDVSLMLAELIWFGTWFRLPSHAYPIVYTIPGVIVVASLYAAGVYTNRRMSVSRTAIATLLSFVVLSALVFFFKDYGFSRGVIIISGMLSILFLPFWRLSSRVLGKSTSHGRKSIFGRRTLIVGTDRSGQELFRRLRSRVSDGYEVLGFVDVNRRRIGQEVAGLPIVGSTANIGKVIQDLKVSDVIFSTQVLSYTDILSVIGRTREQSVNFHLVPNTLEVIIGKGSVDSLDELPLVQITYNIEKATHRALKRALDLSVSLLLLISIYPFVYFKRLLAGSSRSDFILRLPAVLSGKLSLVGPPSESPAQRQGAGEATPVGSRSGSGLNLGKPGLTGLIQLQRSRPLAVEEQEQFNVYYAKNQSLALDIEILLKTLLQSRRSPSGSEAEQPESTSRPSTTPRRTRRSGDRGSMAGKGI
jgi:GT2 family glycosyltransferase/lipopolysaccharide/colanic/teichoic acid biosynthesis glycosyltransferase